MSKPTVGTPCDLCGFPFSHRHRIIPGFCGGQYETWNVIRLCPNHHAMWHHLLRVHRRTKTRGAMEAFIADPRWEACHSDRKLWGIVSAVFEATTGVVDFRLQPDADNSLLKVRNLRTFLQEFGWWMSAMADAKSIIIKARRELLEEAK